MCIKTSLAICFSVSWPLQWKREVVTWHKDYGPSSSQSQTTSHALLWNCSTVAVELQPAHAAGCLLRPQTASPSRQRRPPAYTPASAAQRQYPSEPTPFPGLSSSLLCARSCRTVGLIRPLLLRQGQADNAEAGTPQQIAADQMSVRHLSSPPPPPCPVRPCPCS